MNNIVSSLVRVGGILNVGDFISVNKWLQKQYIDSIYETSPYPPLYNSYQKPQ